MDGDSFVVVEAFVLHGREFAAGEECSAKTLGAYKHELLACGAIAPAGAQPVPKTPPEEEPPSASGGLFSSLDEDDKVVF